jgi:hypothetical protein
VILAVCAPGEQLLWFSIAGLKNQLRVQAMWAILRTFVHL